MKIQRSKFEAKRTSDLLPCQVVSASCMCIKAIIKDINGLHDAFKSPGNFCLWKRANTCSKKRLCISKVWEVLKRVSNVNSLFETFVIELIFQKVATG